MFVEERMCFSVSLELRFQKHSFLYFKRPKKYKKKKCFHFFHQLYKTKAQWPLKKHVTDNYKHMQMQPPLKKHVTDNYKHIQMFKILQSVKTHTLFSHCNTKLDLNQIPSLNMFCTLMGASMLSPLSPHKQISLIHTLSSKKKNNLKPFANNEKKKKKAKEKNALKKLLRNTQHGD